MQQGDAGPFPVLQSRQAGIRNPSRFTEMA
jgi:hypothetical protein